MLPTTDINPAVASCRSDLNRSGLLRSNVTGPDSEITTGVVNWRKDDTAEPDPDWRTDVS